MDKQTLSNYGWVVICVLVLIVMIALATPFGKYVATAVQNTTTALTDTADKQAENAGGVLNIISPEFDTTNTTNENKADNLYYDKVYINEEVGIAAIFQEDKTMAYLMNDEEGTGVYELENGVISALGMKFTLSENGKTISYYENGSLIFELYLDNTDYLAVQYIDEYGNMCSTTYKYEIGMTWKEFIESDKYGYSYGPDDLKWKTFKLQDGIVYSYEGRSEGEFTKLINSEGIEVKETDVITDYDYFN